MRIGFRDNLPRVMELRDTFGNVTTLTFDSFERNVKLDPAQFGFVPPKGADVVGETRASPLRAAGSSLSAITRRARSG